MHPWIQTCVLFRSILQTFHRIKPSTRTKTRTGTGICLLEGRDAFTVLFTVTSVGGTVWRTAGESWNHCQWSWHSLLVEELPVPTSALSFVVLFFIRKLCTNSWFFRRTDYALGWNQRALWAHDCFFLAMTSSLNVFVRVDRICCLLRSTELNRTGKRNQVNSTRNHKHSCSLAISI